MKDQQNKTTRWKKLLSPQQSAERNQKWANGFKCLEWKDTLAQTHLGFTLTTPTLLWATLRHSKRPMGCGNPWTLSHLSGRLGIPTTFLFWLPPWRKKEVVQSQLPHFVVKQQNMQLFRPVSKKAWTKKAKVSRHTLCLPSINRKGEMKSNKQGWRVSPNVLTPGFTQIIVSFNKNWEKAKASPNCTLQVFNLKWLLG